MGLGKTVQVISLMEYIIHSATDFFKESSKDEGRHYRILEGILERYF